MPTPPRRTPTGVSEHFRDLGRKMGAYMDGRPDIELLDGVV